MRRSKLHAVEPSEKPTEPLTLPSRIGDPDLAYLRALYNEKALSQAIMQRAAKQLEQDTAKLESFVHHLEKTYQFTPTDTLSLDGAIARKPEPAEAKA